MSERSAGRHSPLPLPVLTHPSSTHAFMLLVLLGGVRDRFGQRNDSPIARVGYIAEHQDDITWASTETSRCISEREWPYVDCLGSQDGRNQLEGERLTADLIGPLGNNGLRAHDGRIIQIRDFRRVWEPLRSGSSPPWPDKQQPSAKRDADDEPPAQPPGNPTACHHQSPLSTLTPARNDRGVTGLGL